MYFEICDASNLMYKTRWPCLRILGDQEDLLNFKSISQFSHKKINEIYTSVVTLQSEWEIEKQKHPTSIKSRKLARKLMIETILYKYAYTFLLDAKCGTLPPYIMDSFLRFCFHTNHEYLINIIDKSLEFFFFCCFESWNCYHKHYLLNQKRRSNNYDSNTLLKYGFSTNTIEDSGDVVTAKFKRKYDNYCVEKIDTRFIMFMVWLFKKQLKKSLFVSRFGDDQFNSVMLNDELEFKTTKKHPFVYSRYIKKNNVKFILVPNEVQLLDAMENLFLIDPLSCLNIYLPSPFRILTNDKNCKNFIINNYHLGNMKKCRRLIDYSKHKVIDSQNTILQNLRLKYKSCLPQYGDFGGIRNMSLIHDIIHIATIIVDENNHDEFVEATKTGFGFGYDRNIVRLFRYHQETSTQAHSHKIITKLHNLHCFALLAKISILNAIWCNLNNNGINDNKAKLGKSGTTDVYTKLNFEKYFFIKDHDIQIQLMEKRDKLGNKFEKKTRKYRIHHMAKMRQNITAKFNGNTFCTTLPRYHKTNHCCIICLKTIKHKICIPMEVYWTDRAIWDAIDCNDHKSSILSQSRVRSEHDNTIDTILIRKFIEQNGILKVMDMKFLIDSSSQDATQADHVTDQKLKQFQLNNSNQLTKKWQDQFVDYLNNTYEFEERIKISQRKFRMPSGKIISKNGKFSIDIKSFDKKTRIKYCEFCGSCIKKCRKCSGCKITYYCDKICQKKDWLLRHKSICYQKRACRS